MNLPGFALSDKVDRIDNGQGTVNEHSIEFGQTVIIFKNIGSFKIQEQRKSNLPIVLGAAVSLLGIFTASAASTVVGVILVLIGVGLLVWGFTRKPDIFLLIGTCDGRQTNLVSKDKEGLIKVKQFLRDKIDDKMLTAKIDITDARVQVVAQRINRGLAFGPGASAAGAQGIVNASS